MRRQGSGDGQHERRLSQINLVTYGVKSPVAVHRIIWLLERGEPVPEMVDHRDRTKLNNRISNLRAATKAQNAVNSPMSKFNTSGVKGVSLFRGKKYQARIKFQGQEIHLGTFDTLEEAAKARRDAEATMHPDYRERH